MASSWLRLITCIYLISNILIPFVFDSWICAHDILNLQYWPSCNPFLSCSTSGQMPGALVWHIHRTPDLTKALTLSSCLKGCRTSLNVPSTYQDFALANVFSYSCLANIRCLRSFTSTSAWKSPGGMHSSFSSKFMAFGSSGRNLWCRRLAFLSIYSGLGRTGHGASVSSSNRT